ncbi:hypothetical protein M8C21_011334 [Ambrosia artemisiifolia]|uniref:Exonuclease domain-containing protein n=1 Tax=Ambrosia artemisiifolia TaxID=4212 RepID=A0AAD5CP63_AMBAR|nr:hypothetical protein M8C21_011334 [Ambrosia artemisiifolia]
MTSLQTNQETMQKKFEVPASGLQSNGLPQCNGSPVEGFVESKNNSNFLEIDHNELLESSIEPEKKPAYTGSWPLHHADIKKTNLCHMNNIEGQFYPFFLNNNRGVQYAPFTMFPQSFPCDYAHQEFHYFVVIDFEATCDKERNPHPQEIIEFPSVIVSSLTGQLEACFQTYVRPTCNQLLSDFCKDLTGIQQSQVDRGVTLSEALVRHDKWLEMKGIKNANFAVVTWSNWDCRVMLESECRFKKIRKPSYFNRWINLKVPFCEVFGGAKCNLKEAVQMAGVSSSQSPTL